jgi:hypothetical protein
MGYLSGRIAVTQIIGAYLHVIIPDSAAVTGYRSYKILVNDLLSDTEKKANKNQANGYAGLNEFGLVPNNQLPFAYDELLGYANLAAFPATGQANKIYVALNTLIKYSWVTNAYVQIDTGAVLSINSKTGHVTLTTTDINDSTDKRYLTDAQLAKLIALTGIDATAFHSDAISEINALPDIETINDASVFLGEKTVLFGKVKITWALIKSTLTTFFNGLYAPYTHTHSYEPIRGANQNYVTDVEKVNIGNLSGVNSGNQVSDNVTIKGSGTAVDPFYLNPLYIGSNILKFDHFSDFPTTGQEGVLYIDLEFDLIYIWDSTLSEYKLSSSGSSSDANAIHKNIAAEISALTAKTTPPVDADLFIIEDSETTPTAFEKKKLSWANIKATLKSYFETGLNFASSALSIKGTGTNKTILATAETGDGSGHIQTLQARTGTIANSDDIMKSRLQTFSTTVTAAGTTTLVLASNYMQFFTGSTTQTIVLPDVTALSLGFQFFIRNLSSGILTVNSSGGNQVCVIAANCEALITCIAITGTGASSWDKELSVITSISVGDFTGAYSGLATESNWTNNFTNAIAGVSPDIRFGTFGNGEQGYAYYSQGGWNRVYSNAYITNATLIAALETSGNWTAEEDHYYYVGTLGDLEQKYYGSGIEYECVNGVTHRWLKYVIPSVTIADVTYSRTPQIVVAVDNSTIIIPIQHIFDSIGIKENDATGGTFSIGSSDGATDIVSAVTLAGVTGALKILAIVNLDSMLSLSATKTAYINISTAASVNVYINTKKF